jgi:hypothetical protein
VTDWARPPSQRLSRHANRYKEDLRTSSTAVLDRPMSASSRSSSCRSSLYWLRRSQPSAFPVSHASGLSQDHLRSGNDVEATLRLLAGLQVVLPQDMFHLRNGAKQRLARELIGRLSMARMLFISDPPLVLKMNSIALVAVWLDHSTARSVVPGKVAPRIDTINESPANSRSTRTVLRNVSSLIFPKSLKPIQRPATMNGTPTA